MKRRTFISLMSVMAAAGVLSLAGCSSNTSASTASSTAASASAAAANKLETIQSNGKLVIALEGAWQPWSFHDESDTLVGYDVEVSRAIAEKLGVEPDFVEINWDTKIVELDAKSIDCIWNGFTMTGREDSYTFSVPYIDNSIVVVTLDNSGINSLADLKGKTVVAAGKGSTPEYALRYLLSENGIDPDADVTLDWKSEHSECVAALASGQASIALLPQPFVTVAQSKIDGLRMALDLTEEWDKLDNGSALITGVIVARSDFVEAHPAAVGSFLTAYAASVDWVNANTADAAALIGEYGIVDAAVAEKALPYCNIVCITGAELLEKLPGYLSVLYNADPAAVGGAMPDNSFYFA